MFTIYKSNTYLDACNYVYQRLSAIDQSRLDVTHYVVVPDRASLEAEHSMLAKLGGSFSVQVVTINRLFARLRIDFVNQEEKYLSKQSSIVALTVIVEQLKYQFVYYKKGLTTGFIEGVYDTVCRFRYCRISPKQIAGGTYPLSLQGKMHDLGLIYSAYVDFLQGGFCDSAEKLEILCDEIPSLKQIAQSHFYFYDFDNFSTQEIALIEKLALHSQGVTVACCYSDEKSHKYLYLNDIYQQVKELCQRLGIIPVEIKGTNHATVYAEQIGKGLYTFKALSPIANKGFVSLFKGDSRVQEVYALACQIEKYVREGNRYDDVYVVCSDVNDYSNAVSLVFPEFNIPHFVDLKSNLAQHEYCKFVLDYLEMEKNKTFQNVMSFVKNRLYCEHDQRVYHFENYCLKYNVKYGFGNLNLGQKEKNFAEVKAFADKLHKVQSQHAFASSQTVADYCEKVRKFVESQNLGEKLKSFTQEQKDLDLVESLVSEQVEEKFALCLDDVVNVAGNRVVKLEEFIKILHNTLASVDISVVPTKRDAVVFANMAKARKHDVKFLAILGANQGKLPMVKADVNLLTDKNLAQLEQAGVLLQPQIYTENKRERFSLYQLLQEPSKKMFVSYVTNVDGETLMPSIFVEALQQLFEENGAPIEFLPSDQTVYTKRQAIAKVVSNQRKLKDNQPVNLDVFEKLEQLFKSETDKYQYDKTYQRKVSSGEELFLSDDETSVTKITDFASCPYKFFLRYGLKVKPREKAEMDSNVFGNILHEVLEKFVVLPSVKTMTKDVVTKQAFKIFDKVMSGDFYNGLSNEPSVPAILKELKKESATVCFNVQQQLMNSDFSPLASEMAFGKGKTLKPVEITFDTNTIKLRGKIDRVDVCGNMFFVVDYKSGSETSAKFSESSLYYGEKLQLLVYLMAVKGGLSAYNQAVGFYYARLHDEFSQKAQPFEFQGKTLADNDVIKKIDKTYQEKSKLLSINKNKDGSFHAKARVVTAEELDNMLKYATHFIALCGKQMKDGYVSASPMGRCCEYCDYKSICDFGDLFVEGKREKDKDVTLKTFGEVKYD